MEPTPRILMCPPDYYGIEYEINPWMNRQVASDSAESHRQWRALHDTFYGWPVAHFKDGRIVYEHSEIHFAPTHYVELSIYDPVRRRSRQIYPPSPATPLPRNVRRVAQASWPVLSEQNLQPRCGWPILSSS